MAVTSFKFDSKTKVHIIVDRKESNPLQTNLFDSSFDCFFQVFLTVANQMPATFFGSELRMVMPVGPAHPNWWGTSFRKLKKYGFKQMGIFRNSTIESRKGGDDKLWSKN